MSIVNQTEMKTKSALRPQVPDFCPACDAVDHPFKLVHRKVKQEFRRETLEVDAPAMRCAHCDFVVLAPGHLEALRLATLDAYRRSHDLLTSAEIKERRKAMGMSQRDFAKYVHVGVASLQRWENGLMVQDEGSDLLLRDRTRHTQYLSAETISAKPLVDRVTISRGIFEFPECERWKPTKRSTKDSTSFVTSDRFNYDRTYDLATSA